MHRRRLLTGTGLALAASFAGCLSALDGMGDSPGTATLPIRFWLEAVSPPTPERASVDPIVYGDLSRGEREIVRTALEDGEYTVTPGSEPPALEDLRTRIEQRTGGGATLEAYLRREDAYYRVGFADGDHIIAHPDH